MLADEPTSSLDPKTSVEIMELIAQPRRRARHPGDRQHPQCRARPAASPTASSACRRARSCSTARRSALRGCTSAADLRRRRLAGMSDAALPAARARRLPAELAGAHRLARPRSAMSSMRARSSTSPGRASSPASGTARRFISRMFPPNFAPDKLELLYSGMLESLQIAIIATVVGVLLSLPLGLAAARNLVAAAAGLDRAHADRAVPHLPSGHRRDPVREGGRLRRARRHAGADRRLARLPLQAGRRGGRGNVDEAGRGGARDRRALPVASSSWACCRR